MVQWNRRSPRVKKVSWARGSSGFTLPEIMAALIIIGILVGIAIPIYMNNQAKSRDRRRVSDVRNVEAALEAYKFDYGCYPLSDFQGPGGWDDPSDGDFCHYLADDDFLDKDITDPSDDTNYRYYRYNAGSYGIDASRGPFYVLGIRNLEKSGRPADGSPGWYPDGSSRNWGTEFDWVTGGFTDE